jgi:hypothetical protein
MGQSAKDVLRQKLGSFGPNDIGLVAGVTVSLTTEEVKRLEDIAIKFVAAQALVDNVASTPQGLAVRDILPDKDLRTQDDAAISRRDWVQPASGTWTSAMISAEQQVYKTNRNVDNDRKAYVYYGIRASNTGPADASSTIGISSVIFKRANGTKVVDIWQIEEIETDARRAVYARTPILYKRGDDQRIDVFAAPRGSGLSENLIFLGKVAEPLGQNITG